MKRFLLALALLLGLPAGAFAQCNGVFPNNTACGNISGSSNVPKAIPLGSFPTGAGGTNGQVQFNNSGALGGFTASGDCTVVTSTGVFTCTKTSGVSFGPFATTANATTATAALNLFTSTLQGLAPLSGGGTTNFLRADATWALPPQGNVIGSGSPVVGDIAVFNNTSATAVVGAGYNALQVPGLIPTTATVTITNASPGVITWTSHGLTANTPVFFCTTGALPTGLTACVPSVGSPISANNYKSNPTLYYVVGSSITANTFTVATSIANAKAGTAVNTSSAGSGTQTGFANALAPAGTIGELIWNTVEVGSPIAITTATPATWNSLSVPAGIWELGGNVGFIGTSGTAVFTNWHSDISYGLGTSLSTSPYDGIDSAHFTTNDPNGLVLPYTPNQIFLTTTTTLNANGQAAFTGGNAGIYGRIFAKRVR